jgi:hypothetical protein
MIKTAWAMLTLAAFLPAGARADAASAPKMEVRWSLYDRDKKGRVGDASPRTCRQAGVKTLSFTAASEKTGKKMVTAGIPCPADQSQGTALIEVPDAIGPYMMSARAEGRKDSASTYACHVTPQTEISIWIYSEGCDSKRCTDACRGR